MKALISPNELREGGFRVADTASEPFDVAEPFFWIECSEDVLADQFWYNPETQECILIPIPEPEPPKRIPVTDTGITNA